MQFLKDLQDEIIILNIAMAHDHNLTNRFFGKITGRVRVIRGERPTVWVGEFAFDPTSKVFYDKMEDEYVLRVAVTSFGSR